MFKPNFIGYKMKSNFFALLFGNAQIFKKFKIVLTMKRVKWENSNCRIYIESHFVENLIFYPLFSNCIVMDGVGWAYAACCLVGKEKVVGEWQKYFLGIYNRFLDEKDKNGFLGISIRSDLRKK